MDPRKKKNLNPELKAIYERVMNTPVAPRPAPQAPPPPPSPKTAEAAVAAPQPTPAQASTPKAGATPGEETHSDTYLSSVPPRPITSSSQPFVFSSKEGVKKTEEKSKESTAKPHSADNKKMLSTRIIVLLGGVFVIVYGLFWAKLFGLF